MNTMRPPSTFTKVTAMSICAASALLAAALTGLVSLMPATQAPRQSQSPVAASGKSAGHSPRKEPEQLSSAQVQAPDVVLEPPYVVLDATSFENGLHEVHLIDIEGPTRDAVCKDAEGLRWACGLRARAALHNLLRGSMLTCRSINNAAAKRLRASCAIAGQDLGAALVRNGWARPRSSAYASELAEARQNRAGLWNGDWTVEPFR
jgi:endonuclease YncB( thermonuclease family)